MMFLFTVFSLSHEYHGHGHCGGMFAREDNPFILVKNSQRKEILSERKFETMRLVMDYQYINGTSDDYKTCHKVGQQIFWDGNFTCYEEDIITEKKRQTLIKTLDNVQNFITRLVRVKQTVDSFKLSNFSTLTNISTEQVVNNTDLYMTVVLRPFGKTSNTIAAAGAIAYEEETFRPIHGFIFINAASIPDTPSDENSWNNKYFYVLLHEMCHVLGITPTLYGHYHPIDSNQPHENITCSLTKSGKTFRFLITPQAHLFAVKHFGQEYFYGDNDTKCWSGIELEDGGSAGTKLSHPESRIYTSEMMVGVSLQTENGPFNRITDVTVSMLLDTGNYEVDWSLIQPIVWGNKDSIDGHFIPDFATGPPQIAFPSYYIYNKTYDTKVGFNFKFVGHTGDIETSEIECSTGNEKVSPYCQASEFYNALKSPKIGDIRVYDYIVLRYPDTICKDGEAVLPGMTSCGAYSCDGFDSYQIELRKSNSYNKQLLATCTKENIGQNFTYKTNEKWGIESHTVSCVEPERFCRTVSLHEMHFQSNPNDDDFELQLNTRNGSIAVTHEGFKWPTPYIITIIALCVLIVLVIVALVVVINVYRKTKEPQEDAPNKEICESLNKEVMFKI
ncbi:GP63-like [Trichomonas vaginalis G3]|uniref:GP63-like n=1 Tax=Trichomonas vaginalis (strain ATCC PRA-98 / G3) TaxID=412133 RepID=A2DXQ5_TRIV3|nr:regulation of choline O-acetyltransferase protein [Trichomonas vaginalis G3]EAY14765.1 GP63-like [Trichomonas vaginalis G3]KAI5508037.1 regulation of choline O-acetyltransferase protein [Trichomonas vaginalis G3]|eukprot:XP_001326988.1 GP63-like [Trichomonas vaginalis G3]